MRFIASMFLMLYSLNGIAIGQVDCDQVWRTVGRIVPMESPVWATPQFPEDGVIKGFSINELKRENEKLFQPETLEESVCALDIMLDNKTRDALRLGIKDYLGSPSLDSQEQRFDKLMDSIDDRLNDLYVGSGMVSGLGINLILGRVGFYFGISLYGSSENYGPLQQKAEKDGVHSPHSVSLWIWLVYLEHLGVVGFESRTFIEYLKEEINGS